MKNFTFFLILFFAVVLQVSLLQSLKILGVLPNLALVLLIFISFLEKDGKKVFLSALFLGVLMDVLSGPTFGVFLLTFVSIAFLIYALSRIFFSGDNIYVFFGAVLFGTLAYYALYYIFTGAFDMLGMAEYKAGVNAAFFKSLAIESVLNLFLAFLLMPLKRFL